MAEKPSSPLDRMVDLLVYAPDQHAANTAFWSLTACTTPGQKNFLSIRVIAPGIGVARNNG